MTRPIDAASADFAPMLATAITGVPQGPGWAFEPKYDGIRILAFATPTGVRLQSRNGIDKAKQFPEVAEALHAFARTRRRAFVFDGELVARHGHSLGRFEALQGRIHTANRETIRDCVTSRPVALIVFDVLLVGAHVYVEEPWSARRKVLVTLASDLSAGPLRIGDATVGRGAQLLQRAKRSGWEGIVAKRIDAPYQSGVRSHDWVKLKTGGQQEFVVGGWTEPRNTRLHLGALLLGVFEGKTLRYAGHVGSGFTHDMLDALSTQLHTREQKRSPFADVPATNQPAHWVRPDLVVEVRFNEWTSAGHLRQPVFLGLRTDKPSAQVVREPLMIDKPAKPAKPAKPTNLAKPTKRTSATRALPATVRARAAPTGKTPTKQAAVRTPALKQSNSTAAVLAELLALEDRDADGTLGVDGHSLNVTHLTKLYFPKAKQTKGDLLCYYASISALLLPQLDGRPLVLRRYPDGAGRPAFFQQQAPEQLPAGVQTTLVPHTDHAPDRRLVGGNLITLLYGAQLGGIDVNPWHSRVGSLDMADYSVLDLDPGPRATFRRVMDVAQWTRDALAALGMDGSIKTSGARGLHIFVPLPSGTTYDTSLLLAQLVATRVATAHPAEATVVRSVKARPSGTVYVDYLQNVQGKSVASVFSVRAQPAASVSAPLAWSELDAPLDPSDFTMARILAESASRGRLWNDALKHPLRLDTLLTRLESACHAVR